MREQLAIPCLDRLDFAHFIYLLINVVLSLYNVETNIASDR